MTCQPTAVDCVRVSQVLVRKASRWVIATVAGRVEPPELPTSPYSRPRARPLSSAQDKVRTAIGPGVCLDWLVWLLLLPRSPSPGCI